MNRDHHNTIIQRMELIKQCLSDYQYPQYSTLNEDEMIGVVSVENFPNLIKWLFEQIDNNYENLLANSTTDELADVICQHGFCTNKQKVEFINGKLPPHETVAILHRMFNFLRDFKDLPPNCGDINANIDVEECLKDLKSTNIHLFPGETCKFTQEQVQKKLEEYQDQIDNLERIVAIEQIPNVTDFPTKNLNCMLEEIKSNLKLFKIKTVDLLWQKVEDKTPFQSNYGNLGEEFHSKLLNLSQLLQDTGTIFNVKSKNDCCTVNLELVKEKLVTLNNLIEDFDVSVGNND